jgi:tartrate dehydratase beta subunit/fumarate hydratase class I family protein
MDLTGLGITLRSRGGEREQPVEITAAGPTTSMREEPYQAEIIARFGPAPSWQGRHGGEDRAALMAHDSVYLHVTGCAAQFLAERIVRVEAVHLQEFGQPEAMWVLSVRNLPAWSPWTPTLFAPREGAGGITRRANAAFGVPFTGEHPR